MTTPVPFLSGVVAFFLNRRIKSMISEKKAKRYCSEDISLIENYAEAVADQTQTWDIHHKAEILPCGRYTVKNLKDHGLYYKQPAARLVFLTHAEHMRMHSSNKSEEHRWKLSEAHKGRQFSEETRRKMSEARKKYWQKVRTI